MSRRVLASVAAMFAAATLAACGGSDAPATSSSPASPRSEAISATFVGVVAPEVLPQTQAEQDATLAAQQNAGVGVLRQTFQWNEIEPSKGRWSWGMHDQLVGNAARHGITILPIVFNVRPDQAAAPKPGVKVTPTTTMPPKDPVAFGAFAAAIVSRYGPDGTFWKEHPDIPAKPMKAWQVWNEPNLKAYWGGRANEKEYARLLLITGRSIHEVDPYAEIITGGIPESRQGIPMTDYIHLLAKASTPGTFNVLAIHPYGRSADAVIGGAVKARRALDREGLSAVRIWITEFGWATDAPKSPFTVSEAKQGALIAETLDRAAAMRDALKLDGVVYYSWRDVPPYPGGKDFWGLHTGMNTLSGKPKPSLAAFTDEVAALRNR